MANISLFIFFTLAVVVGWSMYVVISIQTKRLMGYSRYLRPISVLLFWTLVGLTLLGYVILIVHVLGDDVPNNPVPNSRDNFVF